MRRPAARLGPGSFAIVCIVLGVIPIGLATLGAPGLTWPTVYARASGCHPVEVHTGSRGSGHEVTACQMRWMGDDGSAHSAGINYPLGDVQDGAFRTVRVSGNQAVDPSGLWANLRFAAVLGGGSLLFAAFLTRMWWRRRRHTVRPTDRSHLRWDATNS
jgi:hypothetical protein